MAAATSGSPKFFLGTDSAPHPKHAKVLDSGAGAERVHSKLLAQRRGWACLGARHVCRLTRVFPGPRLPWSAGVYVLLRDHGILYDTRAA